MVADHAFEELPSYFMECLAFNCPDELFGRATWTDTVKAMLVYMWQQLQGDEPGDAAARWVEANRCFYLFHASQKWTREKGRGFAHAAWNYMDLKNA